MAGTLMSGLNIRPNRNDKDMLIYPGAYKLHGVATQKALFERMKNKKVPNSNHAEIATDNEIMDFINSHEKAQALKEEIAFNKERKKTRNIPGSIAALTTGAGLGAVAPFGVGAAFNATGVEKSKRMEEAIKGAKAMIGKGDRSGNAIQNFNNKMMMPALGAGLGLAAGGYAAHKINEAKRNKVVGAKRSEMLNDISYDLDNHMKDKNTIKRIADNSNFDAMKRNFSLYRNGLQNKQAFDIIDTSFEKIAGFPVEKIAGLKRDMRMARAEANATNPRFMAYGTDIDEYKKQMTGYADSVESFLNSKDKKQDWKTKMEMANLNQQRGFSSKADRDIAGGGNVRSFVESRIADKHNKGIKKTRDRDYRIFDNIDGLSSEFRMATNNKYIKPSSAASDTYAKEVLSRNKGDKYMTSALAKVRNDDMFTKDTRLAKQLTSGKHKQKLIDPKDLYDGKTYFKTHSSYSPFNIGGHHLKRSLNGTPTLTRKGIPIWASKLPEISSEYGDNMVGFAPNKAMIDGASPIDHAHLAKDTRRMSKGRIKRAKVFNSFFAQNHNQEYERVFTYDRKNMNKSINATYKRVGAGVGKVHDNNYKMVKNKPGSLADKLTRDIVNGPQLDFADAKTVKKLDRAHLKRSAQSFMSNPDQFPSRRREGLNNMIENMPSKMREYAKEGHLKRNVALGLGGAAAAGLVGNHIYKEIKRSKERKDFIKKKKEENK